MLTIKNLVKKYPHSEKRSVDDISIELKEGEIFGFLGQNGAGKSTTIKCLTGILPFDSGTIEVCGHDISKDPIGAKMNMGYVPDNHSVYEKLTGTEYVNYVADLYRVPSDIREERLKHYIQLFKLEHAANKQIKSYSHGMKQKICIIAALIHEPKLWVLDEPMMGLDPQSTAEIIAHMKEHCAKGNTVFFSSHNLDLVKKLCNRVAIINEGKIIDMFDLKNNPKNQEELEIRFFKITGTYEKRLFEDYVSQETADMRPKSMTEKAQNEYSVKMESEKGKENKITTKSTNVKKPTSKAEVETGKKASTKTNEPELASKETSTKTSENHSKVASVKTSSTKSKVASDKTKAVDKTNNGGSVDEN
ncbi:MAG: ATP-binding cassette domain-containing protein [Clostridia bacterium]|nr:ATP-binding cassette domain-containing protein [Clostridia bacterium]